MVTSGTHTRIRPVPRGAEWFDDTCQEKNQIMLEAVMRGEDTHLRDQLERGYKAQIQRSKRRFVNAKRFLQKLFAKDPAVHKMLQQPSTKHVTPVLESSWHNHLHNVFKQTPVSHPDGANQTEPRMVGKMQQRSRARRWTETVSGRDHLIPMGRRHTNSQPAGPHPFNMLEDNELLAFVLTQIPNMDTTSSS
eukprot:961510-Pelagomonas_calceolata.AAC.1